MYIKNIFLLDKNNFHLIKCFHSMKRISIQWNISFGKNIFIPQEPILHSVISRDSRGGVVTRCSRHGQAFVLDFIIMATNEHVTNSSWEDFLST